MGERGQEGEAGGRRGGKRKKAGEWLGGVGRKERRRQVGREDERRVGG